MLESGLDYFYLLVDIGKIVHQICIIFLKLPQSHKSEIVLLRSTFEITNIVHLQALFFFIILDRSGVILHSYFISNPS